MLSCVLFEVGSKIIDSCVLIEYVNIVSIKSIKRCVDMMLERFSMGCYKDYMLDKEMSKQMKKVCCVALDHITSHHITSDHKGVLILRLD